MFEQAYYNTAPTEPIREGDFLYHYEVPGWQLGPRIYKILGAAVLANILVIVIFVETPLTARGCDGPLVGRVCQVLDTVSVATSLFGTPREYVDEAYTKTDLGDADITFVDVSGAEAPFEYPAGYFQIANPEDQLTSPDQASLNNNGYIAPGIPTNPMENTPPLINTPQVLPTPNSNPVVGGDLPSFDNPTAPGVKARHGGHIKTTPGNTTTASTNTNSNPTANANTTANPTLPANVPTDPNQINSRPFKDLAAKVLGLQADKKLDLQAPLQLSATAKIDKDGKIAKGSFKFGQVVSNNPALVDVAKDAVAAFNDSNLLTYLQAIGGKRVDFSLQQDQTSITAGITSELEDDTRAKSVVSVIKFGLDLAKKRKQDEIADLQKQIAAAKTPEDSAKLQIQLQNTQDDLTLLSAATVDHNGKTFSISFSSPKDILHQMIQRKLDEQAAEMKKQNGATAATPENSNAINKY